MGRGVFLDGVFWFVSVVVVVEGGWSEVMGADVEEKDEGIAGIFALGRLCAVVPVTILAMPDV